MSLRDRPFPLQCEYRTRGGGRCERKHSVPWEVAEEAYAGYVRHEGKGQTLERLAERGGFGEREIEGYARLARDHSLKIRDVFPVSGGVLL